MSLCFFCSVQNWKYKISLFTPLKLGWIKWFRDEFWDICSAFEWHLLQLTLWFLRKFKRPTWYKKYWNINNLKVSLELGHIFSFGRNNFSSWKDYGYWFLFKRNLSILEEIQRSEVFLKKSNYFSKHLKNWSFRRKEEQ